MCRGGSIPQDPALAKGWFYKPTVFAESSRITGSPKRRYSGRCFPSSKCRSLEEGISVMNDTIYGLSSSVYTNNINGAYTAIRDIKAGITYINAPTIGAEAHMPFGGVKQTGNGHREGGWTVYDFFTEWKAVYVDYSGGLQRAQIDNYQG